MVSDKESIERLVQICNQKGVRKVVISPGSRNAPLIISFDNHPHFDCFNIPDERVAGFFALGLALQSNEPVVLCCTSGSALLNYAPAIAEAYYQKIPLIVLSADRPVEWIDQRAGQTLRQKDAFRNFIKGSYALFEEAVHEDQLWYNDRIINEAIDVSLKGSKGPVHINVPLREPLYGHHPSFTAKPKIVQSFVPESHLTDAHWGVLKEIWHKAARVLVLCGQGNYTNQLTEYINNLAQTRQVIVLTECTSNISSPFAIQCIDRTIESITDVILDDFTPELLITMGNAVVSKKIRFLFRKMKIAHHWHVDEADFYIDTYKSLTINVPLRPYNFLQILDREPKATRDHTFHQMWEAYQSVAKKIHLDYLNSCPWSDLLIFKYILDALPGESDLFLANSTPIRYIQLFDEKLGIRYYANRGVSGIDGCTSTCIGFGYGSQKYGDNRISTIVTGDIAFFYDSNALWHKHLTSNIRIILINNEGGGNIPLYPRPFSNVSIRNAF